MKTTAPFRLLPLVLALCACSDSGVNASESEVPATIGQKIDGMVEKASATAADIAARFESGMAELDDDLAVVKERLGELSGDARRELAEALDALEAERKELAEKLKEAGRAGREDAEQVRLELERAYDALREKADELLTESE